MPTQPILRRTCLGLAALPWLAPGFSLAQSAPAAPGLSAELQALALWPEGIQLDFPPLADTGFSVPLRAEIAAPEGLRVSAIEVFLPENPNPRVLRLRLPEPQARYAFSTRLRLAASQDVWVVVSLSDQSRRAAHAPTVITSSACFDGS